MVLPSDALGSLEPFSVIIGKPGQVAQCEGFSILSCWILELPGPHLVVLGGLCTKHGNAGGVRTCCDGLSTGPGV